MRVESDRLSKRYNGLDMGDVARAENIGQAGAGHTAADNDFPANPMRVAFMRPSLLLGRAPPNPIADCESWLLID